MHVRFESFCVYLFQLWFLFRCLSFPPFTSVTFRCGELWWRLIFCLSVMTLLCEFVATFAFDFATTPLGLLCLGLRWFLFSFCCAMHLCMCAYWPPFPKLHNRTVLVPIYDKVSKSMKCKNAKSGAIVPMWRKTAQKAETSQTRIYLCFFEDTGINVKRAGNLFWLHMTYFWLTWTWIIVYLC